METVNALLSGGAVWIVVAVVGLGSWIVRGHYDAKSDLREVKTDIKYLRRDVDEIRSKI